ncbi:DNA-binding protein, partial [Prunus dulcis]
MQSGQKFLDLIIQLHQDLKILDDDINMRAGSLSEYTVKWIISV